MKRRFSRYHILAIMQVIIAIGAIPTGISFIRDPSGVSSGLNIGLLDNSPFIDFYFPGLFLLVFLGFGNIAGAMISGLKIEVSGFLGLILESLRTTLTV